MKTKWQFEIVIAVEKSPNEVADFVALGVGYHVIEPNGKSFLALDKVRAGFVTDEELDIDAAAVKAIRTACFFFKQNQPEWGDTHLVGLSPELVKRSLVR